MGGIFSQIARKDPAIPEIKKTPSPPRLNRLALNMTAIARPEKISGTAVSTIFPRYRLEENGANRKVLMDSTG